MIDINILRNSPELIKDNLRKRFMVDRISFVDKAISLDVEWRNIKKKEESLRKQKNILAQKISALTNEKEKSLLLKEASKISEEISMLSAKAIALRNEIDSILFNLPNIIDASVPIGENSAKNQVIRVFGEKPSFNFKVRNHIELLELNDLALFENAAMISGSRFYFLKNEAVLLDNALQSFALDFLQKKGFIVFRPPELMKKEALETAISFSDFEEVIYKIENEDLYLIGTAEHPLTAMFSNKTFNESELPLLFCGISSCFRKEAGSHGIDTKGLYRVHEFRKVEQYIICKPEDSQKFHEFLIKNSEELFQALGIHYRIVNICSGDLGMIAAKKYDLEAWLPARNDFGEMVSCSNCTDYQARRAKIKVNVKGNNYFVHTLNSTAIATPRALVAIIENFQKEDGSIIIPKVLRPYLHDLKEINPKKRSQKH